MQPSRTHGIPPFRPRGETGASSGTGQDSVPGGSEVGEEQREEVACQPGRVNAAPDPRSGSPVGVPGASSRQTSTRQRVLPFLFLY